MVNETIGGISFADVICYQTHLILGYQYEDVIRAHNKKGIIIACLRMGWDDAFRHTSKNVIDKETNKSVLETEAAKSPWRNECFINEAILSDERLYSTFCAFAKAKYANEKIQAVTSRMDDLKELIGKYKEVEGEKQVCFGHIQKMFNMAIKMYLCIYMCRAYLPFTHDKAEIFDMEIIDNIVNADCPIDNYVLASLSKPYLKWNKLGTDDDANSIDKYKEVQTLIWKKVWGKSKLSYDFTEWNKFMYS